MREFKRKQAEYPYEDYWLYVVMHKSEARRMANLILKSNTKIRTTISYARYLMSVNLCRFLTKDEHVDHINGDKLDDRVENFQLLTVAENTRKATIEYGRSAKEVELTCKVCGKIFYRYKNRAYRKIVLNEDLCCSVECGRISAYEKLKSNISSGFSGFRKLSEDSIAKIKELRNSGKSSCEISKLTGFARNTVMKYWRTPV